MEGCVLEGLDRLDDGLLVVEGAVLVGEGGALLDGDGDAGLCGDGARGRHEGEGNGEEGGLAEHDELCGEEGWGAKSSAGCREQEEKSW